VSSRTSGTEPKIFITYRREETGPHAGRLYDAMAAEFGEGNVFMDVDMAPGVDFVERITEAVAACHVLIVVMGPGWATAKDEKGTPRLWDPEDFVRLEVETALRRPDVTPIPVLVSGARMPNREDLPEEVRAITRRNALELSDLRWRQDVGRLITTLDELLLETPGGPPEGGAPQQPAQSPSERSPTADAQPAVRPAGRRRRLPWMLLAAGAIVAIVVAVIVAAGGGDSSTPEGRFRGKPLSELVLSDAPGSLLIDDEKSGTGYPGDLSDRAPMPEPEGAYHNTFTASSSEKRYEYSFAAAAVFENASRARAALDTIRRGAEEGFTSESAAGLGDSGWVFRNTDPSEPEYAYAWQTGGLLQVFDLVWTKPPGSEDRARAFAEKMSALVPRSTSGANGDPQRPSTWPADVSAYTVILASESNRAAAEAAAERAPAGASPGILRSDDYASLRPGYWVAFSGRYTTETEAQEATERLRGQGFSDAYPRYVEAK
jgi:TIR domain/SPOR domain